MVYVLQKFSHYLLGTLFKFFTDHYALKYLVNKILGGGICRRLLLFIGVQFEVVVKPGKYNVGPNHLSQIESSEASQSLNDELRDVPLFHIDVGVFFHACVCTY
jgi:hypothetical protein